MVAVIIGREFAVTALRSLAYARGVAIPASPLGKIKMVAQVVAILALILRVDRRDCAAAAGWIGQAALWVVLVTALWPRLPTIRVPTGLSLFPRGRRSQRRATIRVA